MEHLTLIRRVVCKSAAVLDGTRSKRMHTAWKAIKYLVSLSEPADVALLEAGICPACLTPGYLLDYEEVTDCLNCGETILKLY